MVLFLLGTYFTAPYKIIILGHNHLCLTTSKNITRNKLSLKKVKTFVPTEYFTVIHLFIVVVSATLCYLYCIIRYSEYKPVLFIYSYALKSCMVSSQSFGLTDTAITVSVNALYQSIDLFKYLLIFTLPLFIFFPCLIMPNLSHYCTFISSCSETFLPAFISAILLSSTSISLAE